MNVASSKIQNRLEPPGCLGRLFAVLMTLVFTGQPSVLGGQPAVQVTGQVKPVQVCMLNNFVIKDQEGVPYVYQRRTYYFCCAGCIKRFAADPKQFSKAVDPVTEQEVDKADALLYARNDTVYYFSSGQTLEMFADDPDRYLKDAASDQETASQVEPRTGWRTARRK
jgi:YHS domain-containing protein